MAGGARRLLALLEIIPGHYERAQPPEFYRTRVLILTLMMIPVDQRKEEVSLLALIESLRPLGKKGDGVKVTKIKTLLVMTGLLLLVGCVAPHRSRSWSSWTQTAGNAEQERVRTDSPQDDWNDPPQKEPALDSGHLSFLPPGGL